MLKGKMIPIILLIVSSLIFDSCNNHNKVDKNSMKTENQKTESEKPKGIYFIDETNNITSIEELKGKVIFINFWATWCPPCVKEMPEINEMVKSFKNNQDIKFLFVDVDGNFDKSSAFMKNKGYNLPVYIAGSFIPQEYMGDAIPTTVVIDKNGKIVKRIEGLYQYNTNEFKEYLEKLLLR